jgi:hypothetical protein
MRDLATLLKACRKVHRTGDRVGRCIACGKPLKVHFDGKNRFVGCSPEKDKHSGH